MLKITEFYVKQGKNTHTKTYSCYSCYSCCFPWNQFYRFSDVFLTRVILFSNNCFLDMDETRWIRFGMFAYLFVISSHENQWKWYPPTVDIRHNALYVLIFFCLRFSVLFFCSHFQWNKIGIHVKWIETHNKSHSVLHLFVGFHSIENHPQCYPQNLQKYIQLSPLYTRDGWTDSEAERPSGRERARTRDEHRFSILVFQCSLYTVLRTPSSIL